ncbi:glycoside hydrolase family 13 protein [Lachnotalea glycerini]|uniref:Glycoside hydrolase family 13 protein n=1 Tax=Lachnotalea glycerini TaxID=1763509 RepID=A0A371JAM2_9FIRM|nr:glycoside hydrolase family 13 protein [Lachnotalea glycerini]RDY29821.1 glycoside hydrolase family 13 protein [Lachnotalea glycerini]
MDNMEEIFQKQLYLSQMRPPLNRNALFSDETENYRIPTEPLAFSTVTIRFRAEKDNVDAVYLIADSIRYEMTRYETKGVFDFYKLELSVAGEVVNYYFEIMIGKIKCYYNKLGVTKEVQEYYSFMILPGYTSPKWAKGAVVYQIFTDRFYNGDKSNDVENREYIYIQDGVSKVEDWNRFPAIMDVRDFYGGDLQGVIDKLDYLEDLGIEVIYFNPLFVSPSNHKYDIQDYDYIDPHFGKIVNDGGECLPAYDNVNQHASKYIKRVTDKENLEASNQLFAKLVQMAHQRGIKVILDGVFNHCGSFNKWMDREQIYENQEGYEKGAFVSEESPYQSFFKFYTDETWPYNNEYDGWWGHSTLPKLNYEDSPKLYEYMLNVARKWVSPPYHIDGWRLDVAADLGHSNEYNHQFWKAFRKAVKECNPDTIILAEHYGDPRDWLLGDEWDTVMNYDAFMEPVSWFLTGMEKHSDEYREDLKGNAGSFFGAMRHHMASLNGSALQTAMNELSNHDHSRFLTRTNGKVGRLGHYSSEEASQGIDKAIFKEAVIIQMTWPGAPTIYYGDEAGVCGFTDPDNRRSYPWGKEDIELVEFHKAAIALHKKYNVLKFGSIKFLVGEKNVIVYGRFNNQDQIIVLINNDENEKSIEIPAWEIGLQSNSRLQRIMLTTKESFTLEDFYYKMDGYYLHISLLGRSAMVLKNFY